MPLKIFGSFNLVYHRFFTMICYERVLRVIILETSQPPHKKACQPAFKSQTLCLDEIYIYEKKNRACTSFDPPVSFFLVPLYFPSVGNLENIRIGLGIAKASPTQNGKSMRPLIPRYMKESSSHPRTFGQFVKSGRSCE